jgi:hypothetical protein
MTNVISLVHHRMRPLPIAYQEARMNEQCPNCQAPPGDWCRHPDGYTRRIPCVARLHNNDHRAAQEHIMQPTLRVVSDFSEPLRREEA